MVRFDRGQILPYFSAVTGGPTIDPTDEATLTGGLRAGIQAFPAARITFSGAGGDVSLTAAELHAAACRVAAGLAARGLSPGDVLAMQLPNVPEAVITVLAAAELGLVIVPIAHVLGATDVDFALRQSRARACVVAARWRGTDLLSHLAADVRPSTLADVIVVGDELAVGCVPWSSIAAANPARATHTPVVHDRAALLFTSGTTGRAKGVIHTQATLAAEVRQVLRFNDGEEGDVSLVSFPIGHMAGLLGVVRAFYRDRHTIVMDSWDADRAARLVEQHGVTSSAGTPVHLLSLCAAADRNGTSLASIRSFLLGATNISTGLVAAAGARGIRAFRCYGSTEQPTVSCGRPSDSLADRSRTDGRMLPGVEVRIVDEAGHEVEPGRPGEIIARGPDLSPGYLDPRDDSADRTADGWCRTGDIGTVDARGFLTITDRKKDLIIRGGENIASKEVEDALHHHPDIAEVAVVGMRDERYGERVCAVIVARGAGPSLESIRAHVISAGLATHKAPEIVVLVDSLPRTPSGKVQKHLLRRALAATPGSTLAPGDAAD
ncbi:MAG TPA: AMP-binding protein [Ilumatobacteraceae bacterium]